jgi:hypothetical protein
MTHANLRLGFGSSGIGWHDQFVRFGFQNRQTIYVPPGSCSIWMPGCDEQDSSLLQV